MISVSLLAFQAQEAYAGAAITLGTAKTQTATTVQLCFSEADVDSGTVSAADFEIDDVAANSIAFINGSCDGGSNDGVTITAASSFGTDGTPKTELVANSGITHGGLNAQNAELSVASATDNAPPTYTSSATVDVNTITATFSESLTSGTVATSDFSLSDNLTIDSVSVNGAVVTLIVSTFGVDDTPTVTMGGSIDDASAATNTLSSAGGQTATDGISETAAGVAADAGAKSSDTSAPSLGSTNRNGVNTIDNGFSYNFNPTNVAGWKTDYPLIRTPVGAMNTLDLKVMENKGLTNIYFVSVHFGAPQVGKQGEAIVTYYPNQAQKVKIIDPNNLLGTVDFTVNPAKCKADSQGESCLKFSLDHSFNTAPIYDVVGIAIADISRNVGYAYFNHGVEVYGDSLNPPVTEIITDTYDKHTKQITLTQTDRELDLWIDESDNQWTRNTMGSWLKITQDEYIIPDDNTIGVNGIKRINQHFAQYAAEQEIYAMQIWDGTQIQSEIPDIAESTQFASKDSSMETFVISEIEDAKLVWNSDVIQNDIPDYFAFDYPDEVLRNDNTQLQNAIDFEALKANNFLNEYYRTGNDLDSSSLVSPEIMFEGTQNGALHVDYSKLQKSKSSEFDKAQELLYKMYGKW